MTPEKVMGATQKIWEAKKQRRREAGLCITCGAKTPERELHGDKFCAWCYQKIEELMGG
jgi:protein-arginine kinase activator protein McsA